jgi:hypothetical protein
VTESSHDALFAAFPVADAFERLGVPYHVGGSLASSAYGIPRASVDVDLVAELHPEQVDPLVEELQVDYYVDRNAVREAIRRRGSFNMIHLVTMMKVDVFVPEPGPFAQQEQDRALPQDFDAAGTTRVLFVKSAEDLVLRKLLWYRAGNQASERQWSDVVGVLKVQAQRLDRNYLVHWATELRIEDLLARALSDADLS